MSRVEINAGGRHVIVDHDGELEPIRAAALGLWQATDGPQPPPGPAVGFSAERRWTGDAHPTGNGNYSSPTGPVNA